ncbi:MAG: nicotinamide riboside transporter PnuC [Candidatus Pacebacteria bacterium]|nr:nicotinamide riboside transporter PnuC [Candidatus Paceibacterota bacterium]
MKNFFKNSFHLILVVIIIITNIVFIIITKEFSLLGFFGSILGVTSVAMMAKGHLSGFYFAATSNILFGIIAFHSNLYGSMMLQSFYFIVQIIGIAQWKKNLNADNIVKVRKINLQNLIKLFFVGILVSIAYGVVLSFLNNRTPFVDSLVTSLAVTAILLTVKRYQEAWYFWILANISNIVLWAIALNNNVANSFLMLATLVIYLIGSAYGLLNWKKI